MTERIQNGSASIYQDVELSLTESAVPPVVHVKQFDHRSRKVRCTLYGGNVEYVPPTDVVLIYSGTRPDGGLFQYSTEALANDKVALADGKIVITVTDFMTEVAGRYPVDLVMLSEDGGILGSFSFTLYVERAAVKNRRMLTFTYASAAEAVRDGVFEIFTTEDGYFGIESNDGLNLGEGSHSDTVERIKAELVETGINDEGVLVFETDEKLGLVFGMDEEGRFVVEYGGNE